METQKIQTIEQLKMDRKIKYCECGCGELIIFKPHHKYRKPIRYLRGHNARIDGFKKGHTVSKKIRKILSEKGKLNNARYWLGKKRSEQDKLKMSLHFNKSKSYITPEYRRKCGDRTRGKTYEEIYGIEKANILKKNLSIIKSKFKHTQETKDKIRLNTIKQIQDGKMPKSSNTDIEIIMKAKLKELNIKYIHQYNFNNTFICDFYIPSMNTIIECDGEYWHSNGKSRRNDSYKNIKLKERFRILRFSSIMIKKRIEDCVNILFNKKIIFFTWIDNYGWEIKVSEDDDETMLKRIRKIDRELSQSFENLNEKKEANQNGKS